MKKKKKKKITPRPTKVDKVFGQLIRELRAPLMSQSALGAEIGVTFQQVQKYESGVNRVSIGRFRQIAEALDYRPTSLLIMLETKLKELGL